MKRTTKAAQQLIASADFSLQSVDYQSRVSRVNRDKLTTEVLTLMLRDSVIHEESK
jgi:hypothetical protein